MDTSVPKYRRFVWPKPVPPFDAEQKVINDDFVRHWHEVLPQKYGFVENFNHTYPLNHLPAMSRFSTLELGAGIGGHIGFEDLSRQDYYCIELRQNMADAITERFPTVRTTVGDCQEFLPFENNSFDRVVVIHVLEHLPRLPDALDEVLRVLKPGGIFSVVLPCDPGLAYAVARKLSAERIFRRRYKVPYGWFIRREHINSPHEILSLLKDRFAVTDTTYFPLGLPVAGVNICIGTTLRKV